MAHCVTPHPHHPTLPLGSPQTFGMAGGFCWLERPFLEGEQLFPLSFPSRLWQPPSAAGTDLLRSVPIAREGLMVGLVGALGSLTQRTASPFEGQTDPSFCIAPTPRRPPVVWHDGNTAWRPSPGPPAPSPAVPRSCPGMAASPAAPHTSMGLSPTGPPQPYRLGLHSQCVPSAPIAAAVNILGFNLIGAGMPEG